MCGWLNTTTTITFTSNTISFGLFVCLFMWWWIHFDSMVWFSFVMLILFVSTEMHFGLGFHFAFYYFHQSISKSVTYKIKWTQLVGWFNFVVVCFHFHFIVWWDDRNRWTNQCSERFIYLTKKKITNATRNCFIAIGEKDTAKKRAQRGYYENCINEVVWTMEINGASNWQKMLVFVCVCARWNVCAVKLCAERTSVFTVRYWTLQATFWKL